MAETIGNRERQNFVANETIRGIELDEASVEQRFAEIIEAERQLALLNPEEHELRNTTQGYKPNEGYDIRQLKHA